MCIKMICPVQTVVRVNGSSKLKGHSISFPQDVNDIARVLPRLPSDLSLISILGPGIDPKLLHVRRHKIQDALEWLKANNPSYKDIEISLDRLDQFYSDGRVHNLPNLPDGDVAAGPEAGPVVNNDEEELDEGDDGTEPDIVPTMRLSEFNVGQTEEERLLAALRAGVAGGRAVDPPPVVREPVAAQLGEDANPLTWPQQGEPVNERTEGFFAMAYPTLFCRGLGDYSRPHAVKMTKTEWASHLIHYEDRRFQVDSPGLS
jgi:hypothetical protein